jgi:hypothetical protein
VYRGSNSIHKQQQQLAMLAMLFTLLVNFFVLSTAQDLQFAHDVRDPIFASQQFSDDDRVAVLTRILNLGVSVTHQHLQLYSCTN